MEPFCSYNIESKLSAYGIEGHRFTTLTYLLFLKKIKLKMLLRKGRKYIKYQINFLLILTKN